MYTDTPMRITIIAGTNRKKSRTLQLTQYVHSCYAALGVDVTLLDLSTLPPSIFTPEAYGNKPSEFESFSDAVLSANGLVTVTPEYNGSFPGVLKLFIDMLPFPESFEGRPVAFIGLSSGRYGALRSVEQVRAAAASVAHARAPPVGLPPREARSTTRESTSVGRDSSVGAGSSAHASTSSASAAG